jgi:TRAP-type C4-dicarboxylate transport system substrate-binding protein
VTLADVTGTERDVRVARHRRHRSPAPWHTIGRVPGGRVVMVQMGRIPSLAVVIAVVLAAACAADDDVASKAGGDGPTVLRIGIGDAQGTVGAEQLESYVDLVDERSGGAVRLEPVWDAAGRGGSTNAVVDDWDQDVARKVVAGDLDLAVVPARAWDTEGVTTLRALNAPLLVTSDDVVERIVTSDLAGDLLAGLGAVDVVGLALLPEDLRHLLLFDAQSVPDLDGRIVRAARSDTVYAFLDALGAEPDDLPMTDQEFGARIDRGDVAAAEGSFMAAARMPRTSKVIGNVTLFPKLNTLVVNGDVFDGLSDDDQSILRAAADELVTVALDHHVTDADAARQSCRDGGGPVVDATPTDVAAIERAAQSVQEALRQDPATRALLDRLVEVSGAPTTVEGVPACSPPAVDAPVGTDVDDSAVAEDVAGGFPDGVYRMEMPVQVLLDAGVPQFLAIEHAGLWTVRFEDGRLVDPACPGSTYTFADGRVTIMLGPTGPGCGTAAGKVLFSASWSLEGDQLRFGDVRSGHGNDLLIETLFGTLPFTKIR